MADYDDQLRDPYQDDNPDGTVASIGTQLRSLSKRAWATLVYALILVIWLLISDWVMGLAFSVALVAAVVPLLHWWRQHSQSAPLDLLVRSFGSGFILMFWSVCLVLQLAVMPIEYLMFGKVPFLYLLLVNASMVGVEEIHRAGLARWSKKDVAMGRETKAHQLSYTATSIGYATAATLTWLSVLDFILDDALSVEHDSVQDLGVAALALACAIFFGVPLHVLSGYLIGLETTRQTPLIKVPLYPFLLRTLYMYQILIWLVVLLVHGNSLTANISYWTLFVVGMLGTNLGICMLMLKRIKKVEASLPIEYLARVGYLNAWGYGVLPGAEGEGASAGGAVEIPATINQLV